jgi:hypothetical protein
MYIVIPSGIGKLFFSELRQRLDNVGKCDDEPPVLDTQSKAVGFEVLTAVNMKIAVFWVVAPCSLVEVYQRFRGPYDCLLGRSAVMTHRPGDGGSKNL